MANEKWILDGNFVGSIDNRAVQADTIIFLDLPKRIILWRYIKRSIRDFRKERKELVNNYFQEKWEVLKYILTFPREKILTILKKYSSKVKFITSQNKINLLLK